MSGALTPNQLDFILYLKREGVLRPVEGNKLFVENGCILVTCGDGDRFPDIFSFKYGVAQSICSDPRIHLLSWNGGALTLVKKTGGGKQGAHPEARCTDGRAEDKVFLQQVVDSVNLKGIRTIALYVHAPCGRATMDGLSIERVVRNLFQAKDRVRKAFPGDAPVRIAPFMHVDFRGCQNCTESHTQETYFAHEESYNIMIAKALRTGRTF